MADLVEILGKSIHLADQVKAAADEAKSFKQECSELKSKTERLASLLRQAARTGNDLYERPTRRIVDDTEQVLEKALALVVKCRSHGLMKRVLAILPPAAFRKMSSQLDNSIGDVSWLIRVSTPAEDRGDEYLGLPPIASNEPILGLIWEQIATLHTGSPEDRSDAANSLLSLTRDNDRNRKLIIQEGGIGPLLKLAKEGKEEGQENAVRAIGMLGRDPESVDQMIHAGLCGVFQKILKEGTMKVQAVVAWAVAKLTKHGQNPKCQDVFAQHNLIRLLVSHLAFETVQEHSKYSIITTKASSIHAVVLANSNNNSKASNGGALKDANNSQNQNHEEDNNMAMLPYQLGNRKPTTHQMHSVVTTTMAMKKPPGPLDNGNSRQFSNHRHQVNHSMPGGVNLKGREQEDPRMKAHMKAMAAKALWRLAKDNSAICRNITESRALLCFAVLLEKGPEEEVRINSAMALMEITTVAEKDADLRRSAFKPNSPACKAVIDQLLRIIEKAANKDSDSDPSSGQLLVPCIRSIGSLARTFRATETRMIAPLVRLLEDDCVPEIQKEAAEALTKFACTENYLHPGHSKAIIEAGGAKHLIQLVYFGEQAAFSSLILLAYIAKHVPDSEELARAESLTVLEWASKQTALMQNETVEALLQDAKSRLELFQSRGSRGTYH
ncbi:hypothetical protein SAY86_022820 [Trapa natans]|uniref:DUF7792 domain-containing protein n=1 Tax=Trapa natans TaxID=22666 RepID=A0AAN7M9Q6_TRANT|nr:hypothetical protein SAY86_022820 [Trapa natans]